MKNGKYDTWSKEELIREITALRKQKTYGLVWEKDKTKEDFDFFINWDAEKSKEAFDKEAENCFPVLKELTDKELTTGNGAETHILVQGDNYHTLAVLNFTHRNSVDVIYIDPPYNTGNKDFKYNDQLIDKEDGYRHSKWLSFMSKRLLLAKNLLKSSGIIFISIDDNEYAQLKLLCDEIFGDQNFIANMIWRKVVGGKSQGKISTQHEYVLAYAKSEPDLKITFLPLSDRLIKKYRYEDARGKYDLRELGQGKGLSYSESLYYEITAPDGSMIPKPPEGSGYRWSKEKWLWGMKQSPPYCVIKKVKERWVPFVKQYLDYDNEGNKIERGIWPHTILEEVGFTRTGTKQLDDLIGGGKFEHPKPVELIKHLLALHPDKNALIVDFFAGSGTTAQAVLELNRADGGNRHFILATNNENKICTDVCYPRIKKVIDLQEYRDNGKLIKKSIRLKYYLTDFVSAAPTDKNKRKLVDKCTEMLCIKENTFDKVKESAHFKIFKNKDTHLGIIFDDEYINDFVKAAQRIDGKFNVYVFSHDDSVPTNEFKSLKNRVTLCPIPETILKVYRKVFAND